MKQWHLEDDYIGSEDPGLLGMIVFFVVLFWVSIKIYDSYPKGAPLIGTILGALATWRAIQADFPNIIGILGFGVFTIVSAFILYFEMSESS